MNLSAPTLPAFLISIVLAILAVIVAYAGIKIPVISAHPFATLLPVTPSCWPEIC